MQCEEHAVDLRPGAEGLDHPADEMLERLLRHPTGTGARARPERRFDPDEVDAVELARDLHEAAHIPLRITAQQRFAGGGRAGIGEVLERRVVGEERHGLVDELEDGETHGRSFARKARESDGWAASVGKPDHDGKHFAQHQHIEIGEAADHRAAFRPGIRHHLVYHDLGSHAEAVIGGRLDREPIEWGVSDRAGEQDDQNAVGRIESIGLTTTAGRGLPQCP